MTGSAGDSKTAFNALYRIIGIVVSLFSYLLIFASLSALLTIGPQTMVLLGLFISASMVIYSVLSNRFARSVLVLAQPLRYALKDWIKVNDYVTLVFCAISLASSLSVVVNPSQIQTILNQYPENVRPAVSVEQLKAVMGGLLVVSGLTLVHSIWTLSLVRRYKEFFK
jgi:hypothetical protein